MFKLVFTWSLKVLLELVIYLTLIPFWAPLIIAALHKDKDAKKISLGDDDYEYDHGIFDLFQTFDNPPSGDSKHKRETWFPGEFTGWKGYLNRVRWMWRNPMYGLARKLSVSSDKIDYYTVEGNEHITDKYEVPGWFLAKGWSNDHDKPTAWEFYMVKPYPFKVSGQKKCFRLRIGYKLTSSKIYSYGFAQFVDTVTPMKQYGKKK